MTVLSNLSSALAMAGIVAGLALPSTMVPATSNQPLPSAHAPSGEPSTLSTTHRRSDIPLEPSSLRAQYTTSSPPSTLTSGSPSTPPSTPPTEPTTSTTPPPAEETWTIDIYVGPTLLNVGDADLTSILPLWQGQCNSIGCNGGETQELDFRTVGAGIATQASDSFLVTGSFPDNEAIMTDLLNTINAAMLASQSCSTENAQWCPLEGGGSKKRSPETPQIAGDCGYQDFNQCTIANYYQATLRNADQTQVAQLTVSGQSNDNGFDCSTFNDAMGAGASAVDLEPPVAGAIALVSVICDLASG